MSANDRIPRAEHARRVGNTRRVAFDVPPQCGPSLTTNTLVLHQVVGLSEVAVKTADEPVRLQFRDNSFGSPRKATLLPFATYSQMRR